MSDDLLPTDSSDARRTNAESFGQQWSIFDYDRGRTWGGSIEDRRRGFLADMGREPEWFAGKRVLDAGSGSGTLSYAISTLGAEVVGIDVSPSVDKARTRFPEIEFIHGDLLNPLLPPASFDVVYCGGVLHHTPDTRFALERLMTLLRPAGLAYVWLYWRVPGTIYAIKSGIRRLLNPFPYRVRRLPVFVFALQARVRDHSLSFSEHWLIQHDFFTPRWRWEHTPEEVSSWFTSLAMTSQLRSTSRDGFGMLASYSPGKVPET